MSRRSSVHRDVLHVRSAIGLGRFEVGKSRNSYDVPFRSYSIAFEKKTETSLLADEGRALLSEILATATTSLSDLVWVIVGAEL